MDAIVSAQRPSRLKIWLLASRPATLTAALAPVLIGGALARRDHVENGVAFFAALAGALCLQLGSNYANDVFDFEKGADTAARKGPLRVTQAGLVTPAQVKRAMVLAFAMATVCGAVLVARSGWPIVWLGLASIASAVLYTGGPRPLGYLGLGDVFVFAFFGVAAVTGTYFVQAGRVAGDAWLWSVLPGATSTAILVVNNLRDVDTDVLAGKRTLAVRWGPRAGRAEYALLWFLALLVPVAAFLHARSMNVAGARWLLLPLLVAPIALLWTRRLTAAQDGPTFNRLLGDTAKLHLVAGILAALGVAQSG